MTNRGGIVPFFHLNISTCDIVYVTCVCVCVGGGGGGLRTRERVCAHACAWVCFEDLTDGYCGRTNTE